MCFIRLPIGHLSELIVKLCAFTSPFCLAIWTFLILFFLVAYHRRGNHCRNSITRWFNIPTPDFVHVRNPGFIFTPFLVIHFFRMLSNSWSCNIYYFFARYRVWSNEFFISKDCLLNISGCSGFLLGHVWWVCFPCFGSLSGSTIPLLIMQGLISGCRFCSFVMETQWRCNSVDELPDVQKAVTQLRPNNAYSAKVGT